MNDRWSELAAKLLNVDVEDVSEEQRTSAKEAVVAYLYAASRETCLRKFKFTQVREVAGGDYLVRG